MILLTNADAARIPLPDGSVQCVITSPPYWSLRRYSGISGTIWPSVTYTPMPGLGPVTIPGDAECEHVWDTRVEESEIRTGLGLAELGKRYRGGGHKQGTITRVVRESAYCRLCSAWRGMLGLEPTIEMYVAHLVLIFREVRRVLRDDGTLWLNLGSSFSSGQRQGRKYRLRDDLTLEQREYVLRELEKSG